MQVHGDDNDKAESIFQANTKVLRRTILYIDLSDLIIAPALGTSHSEGNIAAAECSNRLSFNVV